MRSMLFALLGLIVSSASALPQEPAVPDTTPLSTPAARPPSFEPRPLFPLMGAGGVPSPEPPWAFPSPYPFWNTVTPLPTAPVIKKACASPDCVRKGDAAPRAPTQSFWNSVTLWPPYVFIGTAAIDHPQLVLNDGTKYNVTDYWRVGNQLYFVTLEDGGTRLVQHTVPFSDLNVQGTIDADTAAGFRFMLRDEPIEQWLLDHPPVPTGR